MKKLSVILISLLLLVSMLLGSSLSIFAIEAEEEYSNSKNSGTRDELCATLIGTDAASYYTGTNTFANFAEMTSDDLLAALRKFMTGTHKYISSYTDCKNYADEMDCQNEDGSVILLYSSYVASTSDYIGSGSIGWNREHVWPKNLGGFETDGAGGDLHHIRPDDSQTNQDRSNKKYGNVNGGTASYTKLTPTALGGYYNSSYYEPLDNVKGDVARICLYVYARWGLQYPKCASITNVFQSVDVLLEWCELDPVDTWEMGRNEVVAQIQGNRNVFIDYPELAWLLFDRDIPSNMDTPSGYAKNGIPAPDPDPNPDPDTTPDTVCTHTNTDLKNYSTATCGKDGYTGDAYCASCKELISKGHTVAASGDHSFGEWSIFSEANEESVGKKERRCIVCSYTEYENYCIHPDTKLKDAIEATCDKVGYSGDERCVLCDELMQAGYDIPKLTEHKFGPWIIIDFATETEEGTQRRSCTVCGEKDIGALPKLESKDDSPSYMLFAIIGAAALSLGSIAAIIIFILKKKATKI